MIQSTALVLAALYALWVFFLAIMALQRAYDAQTLNKAALVLAMPVLVIGFALDVLVNLTAATLLFLEIPREWTVSERLVRLARGSEGPRRSAARWLLANLLATFDPSGRHGY